MLLSVALFNIFHLIPIDTKEDSKPANTIPNNPYCIISGTPINIVIKSDIINVVIVNNRDNDELNEEWIKIWSAFEEAANIRSTRITSNLISLCRFSYGIADYLERVGMVIGKYNRLVFEESKYSDIEIINVCKSSLNYYSQALPLEPKITRNRIYNNLEKQKIKKQLYAKNLRDFAGKILDILNTKYKGVKVYFEVEE